MTAATKTRSTKPVRTLYWDKADRRWVLIIMSKPFVRHVKFDRTVISAADAKKIAKEIS